MAISFASLASSKTQKTEVITSTQSWTAPTGVTKVEVILCGGGGGGAGAPSGGYSTGGAGSVDYSVLTVTPGTSYTITIGAGGAGTTSDYGTVGSTSSFGALFSVPGGSRGVNPWNIGGTAFAQGTRLGGSGGAPRHHSAAYFGGDGSPGAFGFGGGGGGGGQANFAGVGPSGAGAGGTTSGNTSGTNANANTGSGGGGTGGQYGTGGSGGSGICVIKYWS